MCNGSDNHKNLVLNDQRARRISYRTLYVVSLNHLINDGSANLVSTLFPVVVSVLHFLNFQVGILVAVGYLTNMIFQPITGRYSESLEPRKLLAVGISIIAAAMVLFTISTTFVFMLVTVIILRTGSSFFHPVGVSAVSKSYSGPQLDRAMGFQSAFGNLGALTVFLASAPLYALLGWKGPFLVFAFFDFIVVGLTLILLRSRTSGKLQNQADEGMEEQIESPRSRFGLPIYFILTMLISGGAYAVYANFGNLLLSNSFSLAGSNSLMAGWVLAAFIGAILTGPMTRRIKRKNLLTLFYLISAVTTIVFAIFSYSSTIAPISLLLNGFALAATYPMVYSQLSSFLGEKSRRKGSSFGILFSAQIIGSSILGLLGGILASSFGWSLPFEITSALLIVGCLCSAFWLENNVVSETIVQI
jgi:MFS family permease